MRAGNVTARALPTRISFCVVLAVQATLHDGLMAEHARASVFGSMNALIPSVPGSGFLHSLAARLADRRSIKRCGFFTWSCVSPVRWNVRKRAMQGSLARPAP